MGKKCKALCRLNIRRLVSIRRKATRGFSIQPIRGGFHWKYTGVLIFFFYALAFAMIGIGTAVEPFEELFTLGYLFLFVATFLAVGWWLVSDVLEKKRPKLTKKQKKHDEKVSLVPYRVWQWIPVILIVLAFLWSVKLASRIELAKELAVNAGWLVPDNLPTPDNPCLDPDVPESKQPLFLFLGDMATFATRFPHTVLAVNGGAKPVVVLDKDIKGRIAVMLNVFDKDGKIVAWLDAAGFHVNPNNISNPEQKRPNTHTLIVLNQHKEEALYVHYLNKHAIVLAATLWFPEIRKSVPLLIKKNEAAFRWVCRGDNSPADISYN